MSTARPKALITGASSGIGIDFAELLAQRGYDLVVTARREDRLEQLRSRLQTEFGIAVTVVTADLSDAAGVSHLLNQLRAADVRVSVWINNAGLGLHGAFAEQPLERLLQIHQVNTDAVMTLTWAFLREFRAPGRSYLLNVSSFSAFNAPSDYAVYAGTKAFVLNFTQAIRDECRKHDVWISVICPGFFASEFFETSEREPSAWMNLLMMDSRSVARAGLRGLFRGKTLIVPGWIYRMTLFSSRLLPRSWAVPVANWFIRH